MLLILLGCKIIQIQIQIQMQIQIQIIIRELKIIKMITQLRVIRPKCFWLILWKNDRISSVPLSHFSSLPPSLPYFLSSSLILSLCLPIRLPDYLFLSLYPSLCILLSHILSPTLPPSLSNRLHTNAAYPIYLW